MKIRLLDWEYSEHFVDIPDDTDHIDISVISGDMVMTYPIHYDTSDTRTDDFHDGSVTILKKDFYILNEITRSYDLFKEREKWK